jgi:hypothetical protein
VSRGVQLSRHLEDLGIVAGGVVDEVLSVLDVPARRVGVIVPIEEGHQLLAVCQEERIEGTQSRDDLCGK